MNIELIEFIVLLEKYTIKYSKNATIEQNLKTIKFLEEIEVILDGSNITNNAINPKD